ncbi:ABC transporter permease subunit, partial [Anaerotruncus colihominis]
MKLKAKMPAGWRLELLKYVVAALLVVLIGSVIILSQGNSPAEAFSALLVGAFGSTSAIGTTIRWATPSIITGISAVIAFKSGIWNVGIEGQMYFGAFVSAVIGYQLLMPRGVHIVVCLLAAGLSGMLFSFIPAILK